MMKTSTYPVRIALTLITASTNKYSIRSTAAYTAALREFLIIHQQIGSHYYTLSIRGH